MAKLTRIQKINHEKIKDAALSVFANSGYRGSTVDEIADMAGMSKPNLLYYFKTKQDIYSSILVMILEEWLKPLGELKADGEPLEEIQNYIQRKLLLSQENPLASRLFAHEIMQGAKNIKSILLEDLKSQVDETVQIFQTWMDQGKLCKVDPHHLLYMIWATTQHYADFEEQIKTLQKNVSRAKTFEIAEHTLLSIFIEGLRPR